MLPDLDSNQDKQNQNLRYYRYTIGQLHCKTKKLTFEKKPKLSFRLRCPTWIRTKTNSTKNCRTTIILSGNPAIPFPVWERKNMGRVPYTQIFK